MTTLVSVTGISARIFELPGREPFMLAADLAEAYGTKTRRIGEQVKRNPDRFPIDFAFRLTPAEEERLKSQNATSTKANRDVPLAFTHAGALALSGVLKTPIAAGVSVIIHRAFAAMEKRAEEETRFILQKLRTEEIKRKPIRIQIIRGVEAGYDFRQIWHMGSASRPRLADEIRVCRELGLIDNLPAGMPTEQMEMFGNG